MSLAQILSSYLSLNLIIAFVFILFSGFAFFAIKMNRPLSSKVELRFHYLTIAFIFILICIQPFLPKKTFFEPAAKVWTSQSIKSFPSQYSQIDKGGYLSIPFSNRNKSYDVDQISIALSLIGLLLFIFAANFIAKDLYRLMKIQKTSLLFKKLGQISIYINDEITVPFSYWTPGNAKVIIPSQLLGKNHDFRIALAHELQHHRQKDTQWVYVIWLLRIFCILNPFVHLWSRKLSEIQEFACDETLVDHKKVDSQQYARCLVEVAETAIYQKYVPACATGLMFLVERNLLKRRIVKMTNHQEKMKTKICVVFGICTLALLTATAFATQGLVQDKRLSMEEATRLKDHAAQNTSKEFPIVLNDLVLKQLNRYLGTPEGREFIKNSLKRMKDHNGLISAKIKAYDIPSELAALPIIESGYQNLAETHKSGYGAGLWMFITSTAKAYGLKVEKDKDERLNIDLETDAALRYLKSNHLQFKDWSLAILAYNMGENNLAKAIKLTGSRDAWTLIRQGHEGDKDYLPKLMASVIILKNPEILE